MWSLLIGLVLFPGIHSISIVEERLRSRMVARLYRFAGQSPAGIDIRGLWRMNWFSRGMVPGCLRCAGAR